MSKTQLLERPAPIPSRATNSPVERKRDYINFLIFLIIGSFLTATFIKLIDYEMNHGFKWLSRPVQIDPVWY